MASKKMLAFLTIVFITLSPVLLVAQKAQHNYEAMQAEVLVLINKHRAGMGLGPLKMNEVISQAAEKHTRNMATKKIPFGHDGFDARMAGIGHQLKNVEGWAENVAYGAATADEVVDMWLHSPGHKKNIEGNYNLTGFGIVKGTDGQLYYTEIFIYQRK